MPAGAVRERTTVQSFYANLAGGRPDAAFALCSDDIEWNEAEGNPLADRNPYRGAGEIAEGVFGGLAIFEGFAAVPDEFIAENGRVIVIGRYHGMHRKSGAKLDCQAVYSWWVDGGRIVRFQQYADTAQLARLS
jgi:ketosteroid isomerase-like protein